MTRICLFDCHPDPAPQRFIHALCDAYQDGAVQAGHQVARLNICDYDPPLLASVDAFATPPPEPIATARTALSDCDHLVIAFPLWLGGMPAKARAFIEQSARAGFFLGQAEADKAWPQKFMKGKSARVVVTMGMPSVAFSLLMDQAGLKAIERGVLGISGFSPVRHTILGGVEASSDETRRRWIDDLRALGAKAA